MGNRIFAGIASTKIGFRIAFQAPVAQLDRALDFESKGWRFESSRARQYQRFQEIRLSFKRKVSIGLTIPSHSSKRQNAGFPGKKLDGALGPYGGKDDLKELVKARVEEGEASDHDADKHLEPDLQADKTGLKLGLQTCHLLPHFPP